MHFFPMYSSLNLTNLDSDVTNTIIKLQNSVITHKISLVALGT